MGEVIDLRPKITKRLETEYEDQIRYFGNCQERSRQLLKQLWLKEMGQMELFGGDYDRTNETA